MLVTTAKKSVLSVGCLSTKAGCTLLQAESEFVSNHIWHCHLRVISCPDTNSTVTWSWRSNRILSESVWRSEDTKALSRSPWWSWLTHPPWNIKQRWSSSLMGYVWSSSLRSGLQAKRSIFLWLAHWCGLQTSWCMDFYESLLGFSISLRYISNTHFTKKALDNNSVLLMLQHNCR